MSHFLARLVERARGTAPRVEPLVTPRFAPTPIIEIASEVEAPPAERRDQQPTVEEKLPPRSIVQPEASVEIAEGPEILPESEKSSLTEQPEKLLVPMEMSTMNSPAFVRASPSPEPSVPAGSNGIVRRNSFTASRSTRPGSAPLATSRTPVAGIGDPGRVGPERGSHHAAFRPNESPEQPPIVRVTIGRIDVRATPPAVPSQKSPTRSEPKLTLDAYLKSRREGRQ